MADKPTYTTIAGGAVYSATKLNTILDQLATAIEGCLGRGGTSESPNSMSGQLDMNNNAIINLPDPPTDSSAATRSWVTALVQTLDTTDVITAGDILTLLLGVDGAGSGLDADKVDGFQVAEANTADTIPNRDGGGEIAVSKVNGDLNGDVRAPNGVVVLDQGTDGSDATFVGDITGDVTGNVTGNVVGNITGDLTGGIVETGSGAAVMKTKVFEIGDWNMDTTSSTTVTHGVTYTKIRMVDVLILDDSGLSIRQLSQAGSITIGITSITLNRDAAGTFDNTGFDATPFNRGWVTIWYEV